ncbi:Hypothetical protein ORPV_1024 [Orpheovirus IHUMI-LCC2]|uniref:Uncharacterized protein n=1 Tax=Orpheovirus IHUMI-LCC2 TaxID=2023057 RepID=A0A2I2L5V3_9VIRU|nr:Hypothetical protein ORPV_1024 [Orpheovirus IHUMI-LCC2]SNW62928.1 Hypothetical protein ORPV_1024 [Orpheovirus IHUMI-LCC2]
MQQQEQAKQFIYYKNFDASKLTLGEPKLIEYVGDDGKKGTLTSIPIQYNYGTVEKPSHADLNVISCNLKCKFGVYPFMSKGKVKYTVSYDVDKSNNDEAQFEQFNINLRNALAVLLCRIKDKIGATNLPDAEEASIPAIAKLVMDPVVRVRLDKNKKPKEGPPVLNPKIDGKAIDEVFCVYVDTEEVDPTSGKKKQEKKPVAMNSMIKTAHSGLLYLTYPSILRTTGNFLQVKLLNCYLSSTKRASAAPQLSGNDIGQYYSADGNIVEQVNTLKSHTEDDIKKLLEKTSGAPAGAGASAGVPNMNGPLSAMMGSAVPSTPNASTPSFHNGLGGTVPGMPSGFNGNFNGIPNNHHVVPQTPVPTQYQQPGFPGFPQ